MARRQNTLGDFASDLVTSLGGKPTKESTNLFNSWQRWEGGWTANKATFNPLNLTAPGSGLPTINSVGVVAIPSYQEGVRRTAELIRSGYPAIARALATGRYSFQDPGLQADLNRWLSGKRTPGMTPYVSKIASTLGGGPGGSVPTSAAPAAITPGLPPASGERRLDPFALSKAIRDQFIAGKGTIDLMNLPGTVRGSWTSPVPPSQVTGIRPGAPPPSPLSGMVPGAATGSPIVGGSHGGEHGTSGLAGYSGVDYFAKPGAAAVAPVTGTVVRLSGHDPKLGAVQGAGGPLGWSVYIQGDDGRSYYLTHMGSRNVKPGQKVKAGQRIGTVADYDKFGRPSHIHMGVR